MKDVLREILKNTKVLLKNSSREFRLFLGVLLVIILWGYYNWFLILTEGPGLTGSSDVVPWGVYIIFLAFFIGCSAGATIVGLLIHGFGREGYKPIGTQAIIMALICIFGATLFVLEDVGVPSRALLVPWVLRNLTSLFVISSSSYYVFMVILTGELYFTIKMTLGKATEQDEKIAKWLGILAVPYAFWVVHAFTGSIFGVVKARGMWNTPILPVHFVVSALASGFALVIFVAILTSRIQKREILNKETLNHARMLLVFFVAGTLFLDFFDYLILLYSGKAEAIEEWKILTKRFAPGFVLNIGGMTAAILILLSKKGRTTVKGLVIATVLTILSILAYRIDLVIVGQLVPLYPGLGEIYYYPTMPEISTVLGLIALIIFLYTLLSKILPFERQFSHPLRRKKERRKSGRGSPETDIGEIEIIKRWR